MISAKSSGGFFLLEVLVATSILTVGLVGMAQLFAISARANGNARTTTVAAVLAGQKMEELRGLTWGFDVAGLPVSDSALSPSPTGALQDNLSGYVDYLDASGSVLSGDSAPPVGPTYVRRWSISPLPTRPDMLVLQVLVICPRAGAKVRFVSVKTRKVG